MIGKKVEHIKWGPGVITSFNGKSIDVLIKGESKKLAFPMSFEKWLIRLTKKKAQKSLMDRINELDTLEKKKNLRKKRIEERHENNLLKMGIAPGRGHAFVTAIRDLMQGYGYSSKELCKIFDISLYRRMCKSNTTNSLVLISRQTSSSYRNPFIDRWDNKDIFHFTGEGQNGDQNLKGNNYTLSQSGRNEVTVYLFESYNENEYIYRGEVKLSKCPYAVIEKDSNAQNRRVYKFPLKVID